jgi:RNA polymerase sigma factor (sigma-70 family)
VSRLSISVAWSDAGAPPILAKYDALVMKLARTMRPQQSSGNCLDVDDLVAEGRIGVLEAVATYDGFGTNEFGWVMRRVRHRMLDAIRRLDVRSRSELKEIAGRKISGSDVSDLLSARHVAFARDEADFLPRDGGQEDEAAAREVQEIIFAAISALDGKARVVADEVLLRDEPMAEVAELLGVSVARVSQIYQAVCEAIRSRIEEETR